MRDTVIKRQIRCIKPIEKQLRLKIKKLDRLTKKSKKQINKSERIRVYLRKNRKIKIINKKRKTNRRLLTSNELMFKIVPRNLQFRLNKITLELGNKELQDSKENVELQILGFLHLC